MTNKELRKEFKKFLKEHEALKAFKEGWKAQRKVELKKFLKAECKAPNVWIVYAFIWSKTPQGHYYWKVLYILWKQRLKELLKYETNN